MKYLSMMLAVLMVLSLLGCGVPDPAPSPEIPKVESKPDVTEQTTPQEPDESVPEESVPVQEEDEVIPPIVQPEETEPDATLDTPYFTLTITQEWASSCVYEIIDLGADAYNLSIYETQDYEDWMMGNLFSLLLLSPEEDYTVYPSYEILGTLKSPDWVFNVVVLYPTDVQFSEDTEALYSHLYDQIPSVLTTLTAKDPCVFYAGEIETATMQISTPYYTLSVPKTWANGYTLEIVEREDSAYNLVVYETRSYQEFGGGKLCTLMMVPTDDASYTDFPDYEMLCALDTPEGSFYVVALFPTDVQFDADTAEDYNAMAEELMDVLYSIRPVGDIEMAMP